MSLLLAPRAGTGADPVSATTAEVPSGVTRVVTWFGAMQAQDSASAAWSFGVRLPGTTAAELEAAFERREALRTWPMRGTVHYVPCRDAHWMLDLMGSRMLAGSARRREMIGLSDEVAHRSVEVLGGVLAGGGRLTRAQCLVALREAGIEVDDRLGYHLLWYASQLGVTCFAPNIGKEQSFVLLDEWVSDPLRLERDEALATIALRYFRSHGPATRTDFVGWTGLTVADCRRGIAAAGDQLTEISVDGTPMYLERALLDGYSGAPRPLWLALPGFDEYLLGFKDRSLFVADEHKQAIIPGGNGVFQATVVRAGRVVGIWKRVTRARAATVTVTPLVRQGHGRGGERPLSAADQRA
jgi:hypothetical protein